MLALEIYMSAYDQENSIMMTKRGSEGASVSVSAFRVSRPATISVI